MNAERYFLDTAYVLAIVDRKDQYHQTAMNLQSVVRDAREIWTTEAVLIEIGNALSAIHRAQSARFIRESYRLKNMEVERLDTALLSRALALYESRPDKRWGMTDCISFVVMHEQGLTNALTSDHHFVQAGFRAILLEGL